MKDNKLVSWLRKQQWSGWRVENERFKFSTTFQIVVFLLRLEDWQKILKYIAEFPAKIVTVVQFGVSPTRLAVHSYLKFRLKDLDFKKSQISQILLVLKFCKRSNDNELITLVINCCNYLVL